MADGPSRRNTVKYHSYSTPTISPGPTGSLNRYGEAITFTSRLLPVIRTFHRPSRRRGPDESPSNFPSTLFWDPCPGASLWPILERSWAKTGRLLREQFHQIDLVIAGAHLSLEPYFLDPAPRLISENLEDCPRTALILS
jgi:hypothetical protein